MTLGSPVPLHVVAMEQVIRCHGPRDKKLERVLPKGHPLRMRLETRRIEMQKEINLRHRSSGMYKTEEGTGTVRSKIIKFISAYFI